MPRELTKVETSLSAPPTGSCPLGEVFNGWEKGNIIFFKKEVPAQADQHQLPREATQKSCWKHMESKKVSGNSTHQFIEDKSAFGNLTASYEEMVSSVDKGTAMDIVSFGFQNTFGTLSHRMFAAKSGRLG